MWEEGLKEEGKTQQQGKAAFRETSLYSAVQTVVLTVVAVPN